MFFWRGRVNPMSQLCLLGLGLVMLLIVNTMMVRVPLGDPTLGPSGPSFQAVGDSSEGSEKVCPDCNGVKRVTCPTCQGKKKLMYTDGLDWCDDCHGSGFHECRTCLGRGKITSAGQANVLKWGGPNNP